MKDISSIIDAQKVMQNVKAWLVTDGKMGDLVQCRGIAERLALIAQEKVIKPRAPYSWFMPYSWRIPIIAIDPKERPSFEVGALNGKTLNNSPLNGEMPDLVIASGRRAASYLPAIKAQTGGKAFTCFLKDPCVSAKIADFIWVPEHDSLRGENVMTTLLSPHLLSQKNLENARLSPPKSLEFALPRLKHPRVAVLIGGNSKSFTFLNEDIKKFGEALDKLHENGASIMATTSRRTPPELLQIAKEKISNYGGFLWDGEGENPYRSLISLADAFFVTKESVNMVGEALVTGKSVMTFSPTGKSSKIDYFLGKLQNLGLIYPFSGKIELSLNKGVDATPEIAIALVKNYVTFKKRS